VPYPELCQLPAVYTNSNIFTPQIKGFAWTWVIISLLALPLAFTVIATGCIALKFLELGNGQCKATK